jgi:hypothetical protein
VPPPQAAAPPVEVSAQPVAPPVAAPAEAPPAKALFHRKLRKQLAERLGGSRASEAAVDAALKYLAANQEPDGRWTYVRGRRVPGGRHKHDTALTGLAAMCFLAADHTPDKPGAYQQSVSKALDHLAGQVRDDGDLRGRGNMYDQAIGTLALAEAAAMTTSPRYRRPAVKAARFIVKAQNVDRGGWRYDPRKDSDTSVFGWQVMALHSVSRLGVAIPKSTREGAFKWLGRVTRSRKGMLSGYRNADPSPAMTAQAVFSRVLLAQPVDEQQTEEFAGYLLKHPPGRGRTDLYYLYYGSLAMMQFGGRAWEKWNTLTRERLVKLQQRGGELAGSWPTDTRWALHGGRIYTTAMATLTLEVYYRYLPIYTSSAAGGEESGGKDSD